MIKPLRQRHVQIWIVIGILLPVLMTSAWLMVPHFPTGPLFQPPAGAPLPIQVKKVEKVNYTVILNKSADGSTLQLEWINKNPILSPTALIYRLAKGEKEIESAEIVGRIEGRGTYYFRLKKDTLEKEYSLVLYDIIHHRIIDQIQF